jgi:methylthioribose-1-phosphate isomerase
MRTVYWDERANRVQLIDQTKLPLEEVWVECRTYEDVAHAITSMQVRGAPAIGVTAAYGIALGVLNSRAESIAGLQAELERIAAVMRRTRPTAVNLFWAINRMLRVAETAMQSGDPAFVKQVLLAESQRMADEDVATNEQMGAYGAELIKDGDRILTHCNAGALATVDFGTAVGVIRAAHRQGKRIHVYVDETRPFLQGARLTAWELQQEGIPYTLITDNMAGHFMQRGQITMAIVGADRIAANGDVANKIGTYTVGVLCKEHGLPLYVAAPLSTIDMSLASGDQIPIEERSVREVVMIGERRIAPEGAHAAHPAFDVTPARYVRGIITEQGVISPPLDVGLKKLGTT